MITNGDMSRVFETSSSRKKNQSNKIGLFHGLTEELKLFMIIVSMDYAPASIKGHQVYLSKQRSENTWEGRSFKISLLGKINGEPN